jgi:hypothetical protein
VGVIDRQGDEYQAECGIVGVVGVSRFYFYGEGGGTEVVSFEGYFAAFERDNNCQNRDVSFQGVHTDISCQGGPQ